MVVLDKLDQLSFCQGLSKEYQQQLVSMGHFKSYQPGEYLFLEGTTSSEIYLLTEGKVALETAMPQCEPMLIQTVEAGELLGWSPILGLGVMTASACAVTPCRVLALNAARIRAMADSDPAFVLEFMRRTAITLARRLNATRKAMLAEFCSQGHEVS